MNPDFILKNAIFSKVNLFRGKLSVTILLSLSRMFLFGSNWNEKFIDSWTSASEKLKFLDHRPIQWKLETLMEVVVNNVTLKLLNGF